MSENNGFRSLLEPQNYTLPIAVAGLIHLMAALLLWVEWPEQERKLAAEPTPKHIQAKVIQTENKAVKKRKLVEQRKLAKKRRQEKQRKDRARKKAAEKKRLAAEKKKALAKKAADKKKAEALKKAAAAKEKAEQEKAAQKKLAEQEALRQQEEEESLLQQLAVDEELRAIEDAKQAEAQAAKNDQLLADYASRIRAKVSQAWRYPPSARPDMEVKVRIQLVPSGEVINVVVESSSGNEALDRSVLAAVNRAQPLPVPKDIKVFEQQFRNFIMAFRPEDAVW